jgi:hypothetical protein
MATRAPVSARVLLFLTLALGSRGAAQEPVERPRDVLPRDVSRDKKLPPGTTLDDVVGMPDQRDKPKGYWVRLPGGTTKFITSILELPEGATLIAECRTLCTALEQRHWPRLVEAPEEDHELHLHAEHCMLFPDAPECGRHGRSYLNALPLLPNPYESLRRASDSTPPPQ